MKKFLKILLIVVLLLLALIITLPFVFQAKIVDAVKLEINKSVNARVDFGSGSLSLIRSFPDFSLSLNKISVTGNFPFDGDTLFFTDNLRLTIDLGSVFRGSPYELKKIQLNRPLINLLVHADGAYNWDIMLPEDEITGDTDTPEADEPLLLNLKLLSLKNGRVVYDDKEMDFILELNGLDGNLSGSLSTGLSDLFIEATAASLMMDYEGMRILNGVKTVYQGTFLVDLENDYYTMRNNKVWLNKLAVDVDGGFGFVDEGITMALNFSSSDSNFKNLLSLVPAVYTRDFEAVKTDGNFSLNAHITGLMGDVEMPGFGFNLEVNNAHFSYPDLPEKVSEIFIKTSIENKSGDMDDTNITVERFDFVIANNPFKSTFALKTPMSDPEFMASFAGKLNLESLSQALPMEPEETLSGLLEFDAAFSGRMSDIENSRYNRINAGGFLVINDFDYRSASIDLPLMIHTARFNFSPAYFDLANMDISVGRSRMQTSGRIENYLAYYLGEGYLMGRLALSADLLDVNELLAAMPSEEVPDETAEEAFQLPDLPENVDFAFDAGIKKIIYGNYQLNNATANITYKDQVLRFNPLKADMLAGKVEMRGLLDGTDKTAAFVDMDFRISNFDIPMAYQSIGMLQQVAPVADRTTGNFSTGFKLRGKLDNELNPVYESLQGGGSFQTSQLLIESGQVMEQLARLLGNDDYKRLVTDGINAGFEFVNGRIFQKPFTLNWAGTNTTMSGFIGFDRQINYDMVFQIPHEKFGAGANQALRSIADAASRKGINVNPGSHLNVTAKLTGLVTNPKIELDYRAAAAGMRSELEDAARRELEKQKEEALKKLGEEAERILSDARARADEVMAQAEATASRIRSEAATAAEKVRSEATAQANKLEEEGRRRGPVAELAARESARKVRTEGDNSAQRIISEADKRAADVIRQAQTQSDQIMQRAQEQVERLQ